MGEQPAPDVGSAAEKGPEEVVLEERKRKTKKTCGAKTRARYSVAFKVRFIQEVRAKGQRLMQVAARWGVALSLASKWMQRSGLLLRRHRLWGEKKAGARWCVAPREHRIASKGDGSTSA